MNSRGFTLMELIIGGVIILVALLGLLGVFTGCFNLNESSRGMSIAINDALF